MELARRGLRDPLVLSGRLRRQRDTAELAMAAAGLPGEPEVDGRWDEYDHVELVARYAPQLRPAGTAREFQQALDQALGGWVRDGDAGGWPAFVAGAGEALGEVAERARGGRDAVVVTSGGVLAAVCAGLLRLPADAVVALHRVSANGGLTKLVVGSSGTSLVSFNDHAHFEGQARRLLTYR